MKRKLTLQDIRWNYRLLAFLIPCVGFSVLLLAVRLFMPLTPGFSRDGIYTLLYSDKFHQYYPFFKAFRQALLSGDSLLYNWDVGMGMDYLGLASYYLASPLNLVSVILPESWLLGYFELLTPIKLGLAGLFFATFLYKLYGKDDIYISLFGAFYGLCAWALGYQWNIMWLDTFALLPLVALGTVYLLRDKKFVLYTVTLFLSIFSNYYVGFFTCIFVLLLFFCYQICRCKSIGRFIGDFCRIGIFTVLAIGMTAVLELPALAALQDTQSSVNSFPNGFAVNMVTGEGVTAAKNAWRAYKEAKELDTEFLRMAQLFYDAVIASLPPLMEGMRKVVGNMNGGIEPSFKEGLPNLYCGVGTVFFAFLYLTCGKIKVRDKLCSVFLLVFFGLSFILRQLDYIWHGFHFTNMIPYRFSFLYSFVMLYMAYRAFLYLRSFELWQFVAAGLLSLAVMLCYAEVDDPVFLAYNLGFFTLYFGVLVLCKVAPHFSKNSTKEQAHEIWTQRKNRRQQAAFLLPCIMALELILNIVNFGASFAYTNASNYPKGTEAAASMIRYMKERENELFYRAEVTHSQTLNDGALNDYHGVTTFTSSANVKVTEFMKNLGFGAKNTYNRYLYEEASPVSNLFLGLKYLIERDGNVEENPFLSSVHSYQGIHLLENNAYLPLGFLANSELADLDFEMSSHFYFQNALFEEATGIENVWSILVPQYSSNGVKMNSTSAVGQCTYSEATNKSYITYTYHITQTGFMCINANFSRRNSLQIIHYNEEERAQIYEEHLPEAERKKNPENEKLKYRLYSETPSLPQMYSVCQVYPGDTVEIRVSTDLKSFKETGSTTIQAAVLDNDAFWQGYDILNASTLQLTEFRNTYVSGTIQCDRDGLLYTSIPQNGNWSVTVDGEEAEIKLVGEAMIGVELTEGFHTVAFTYHNEAFSIGWKVSLACALIFGAVTYLFCFYLPSKRKGKDQQSAE